MFEFEIKEYNLPENYSYEDLENEREEMSVDEYLEIMQVLAARQYCENTSGEERDRKKRVY